MRAALLCLMFLAGCASPVLEAPFGGGEIRVADWDVYGLQRSIPTAVHAGSYVAMIRCVGDDDQRDDAPALSELSWFQSDSIVPVDPEAFRPRGLSITPQNQIILVRDYWLDKGLISHEILHQLTALGLPHSAPVFLRCDPLQQEIG